MDFKIRSNVSTKTSINGARVQNNKPVSSVNANRVNQNAPKISSGRSVAKTETIDLSTHFSKIVTNVDYTRVSYPRNDVQNRSVSGQTSNANKYSGMSYKSGSGTSPKKNPSSSLGYGEYKEIYSP